MKDAAQIFRGDADALISDGEHGRLRICSDADEDGLALAELQSVGEQVREHLLEPQPIPLAWHGKRSLERERHAAASGLLAKRSATSCAISARSKLSGSSS